MTDAKELLWLDDEDQVIVAPIQAAYVMTASVTIPEPWLDALSLLREPDRLVVEYRPHEYNQSLPGSRSLWIITDEGDITPYILVQWQYLPWMLYPQLTLVSRGIFAPVPVALVRYIEAFKAVQHAKETSC